MSKSARITLAIDFVATAAGIALGYAATGSMYLGLICGAAIAGYGCWCFWDGAGR